MRYLSIAAHRRLIVPQISICLGLSIGILSNGAAAANELPAPEPLSPPSAADTAPSPPLNAEEAPETLASAAHADQADLPPDNTLAQEATLAETILPSQPACVAACNRTAQFMFRLPDRLTNPADTSVIPEQQTERPQQAATAAPRRASMPPAAANPAASAPVTTASTKRSEFGMRPISNPPAAIPVQAPDSDYQAPFPPSSTSPAASPDASPAASPASTPAAPGTAVEPRSRRTALTPPSLRIQGVYVYQGGESSARARLVGVYPLTPNLQAGGSIDLTTGDGDLFNVDDEDGVSINELYLAASLPDLPNLRFVVGQLDLTSYFDRNSFAKDGETQFFNPVFQTNPALTAASIGSRPGALVNWSITDDLEARAAVFSSDRSISDFALNGFAGEVGLRLAENFIIRGTYATGRDGGADTGFREIFSIRNGRGLREDDREEAYGVNAELFIPAIRMGIFGRYGRYENLAIDEGGDTFVVGVTFLDLFLPADRLGIGYGRELSSNSLRQDLGNGISDVGEIFYDFEVIPNLRLGFTVQALDDFSETIAGVRVRTVFDLLPRRSQ